MSAVWPLSSAVCDPASLSRAVSRSTTRRLLAKMIVERCAADQLQKPCLDRRPDRARWPAAGPVERDDHLEVELASAGRRRRSSPAAARTVSADRHLDRRPTEVARDLVERPLRGRQADPDEAAPDSALPAAPAAGPGRRPACSGQRAWISSTITCETRPERLAGPAGQHQVERFGRGDQDVGRLAEHPLALGRGRVAASGRATDSGGQVETRGVRPSRRMPSSGNSRLRQMSWFSAFSGET